KQFPVVREAILKERRKWHAGFDRGFPFDSRQLDGLAPDLRDFGDHRRVIEVIAGGTISTVLVVCLIGIGAVFLWQRNAATPLDGRAVVVIDRLSPYLSPRDA